jgi:hypothetical protein
VNEGADRQSPQVDVICRISPIFRRSVSVTSCYVISERDIPEDYTDPNMLKIRNMFSLEVRSSDGRDDHSKRE